MRKWPTTTKPTLFDYFLLSRPYTLPSIALVAILGGVLARKALNLDWLTILDVVFGLSAWATVMYFNEALKKKPERPPVPYAVPAFFFLISLGIVLYRNFISVFFLATAILTSIIYWLKSKNWFGSPFVFIVRGGTEVSIFFAILFFYGTPLNVTTLTIAMILLLATDARNLIGDIRDSPFDKYTFPTKFGTGASRALSIALLFGAILLSSDISVSFPLIVMIFLITAMSDGYLLHQIFIPTSTFFLIGFVANLLAINLFIVNLAYVAVLLGFTYTLVPRQAKNER